MDDTDGDLDAGGDGADGLPALAAGQDRGALVVVDHGSAAADPAAAAGGVQAVGGLADDVAAAVLGQGGSPGRSNRDRAYIRERLPFLVADALAHAGVDLTRCRPIDTGDGVVVVLDPAVSVTRVLDGFITRLHQTLHMHNASVPSARAIRLRVAVHGGLLPNDAAGQPVGEALIVACRLVDATPLRAALAATTEPLVVAVSAWIYDEVVVHAYGRIDPAEYVPVQVAVKEYTATAWIRVPGDPTAPYRSTSTDLPEAEAQG